MDANYREFGVQFSYPDHWELSESETDALFTITVSSPTSAFWSLTLMFSHPDPADVLDAVENEFRNEYEELDVYPAEDTVSLQPAEGRDIEFICLELLNTAWIRAFRAPHFTGLVLSQFTDLEADESGDVLRGITATLVCRGDHDPVDTHDPSDTRDVGEDFDRSEDVDEDEDDNEYHDEGHDDKRPTP
jgi:hypothetical protein